MEQMHAEQKQQQQQQQQQIHIDIQEVEEEEEAAQPQAHNKTQLVDKTIVATTTTTAPTTATRTESTIINIPTTTTTTVTTTTTAHKNFCSSLSTTLSAYDTDSSNSSTSSRSSISSKSTVSSTCCTRHGEEIYMEHGLVGVVGVSAIPDALDTDGDDDADAIRYKTDHRKSWPIFILAISLIEVNTYSLSMYY